ncbi:hypothetical protein Tco_0251892 [Tanacetum coccineum]
MAIALAATSIIFKDDDSYSAKLLQGAALVCLQGVFNSDGGRIDEEMLIQFEKEVKERIKELFNGYEPDLGYNGTDDFREGNKSSEGVIKPRSTRLKIIERTERRNMLVAASTSSAASNMRSQDCFQLPRVTTAKMINCREARAASEKPLDHGMNRQPLVHHSLLSN